MKKIIILTLILGYIFAANITMKDYLSSIVKHDPAYKAIFYDTRKLDGSIKSLEAVFDAYLYGSYEYRLKDDQIYNFGGIQATIQDNKSMMHTAGLKKKIRETGTEVDFSYLRMDSYSVYGTSNIVQIDPSITLKLTQPLWQNIFGIMDRFPLEKLDIQKQIVLMSEKENEEKYFQQAISLYYDWLSLTLALEPLKVNYNNAVNLKKEIEEQYRNDAVILSDVFQARNTVKTYENSLFETLRRWNQLGVAIYNKMGKTFKAVTNWKEINSEPVICDELCSNVSTKEFVTNRAIDSMQLMLDSLKMTKEENDRRSMPVLEVYGEASKYKSASSATDSLSDLNKNEFAVGFSMSGSLENSAVKGTDQINAIEISKAKEDLDQTKLAIKDAYYVSIEAIGLLEKEKKNAEYMSENYEKIFKLEKDRFKNGKTNLYNLNEYSNRYVGSKINYLNKLIELKKLELSLSAMNDELLDEVQKLMENK